MKTLIQSGQEKILSLFYAEKSASIHLREIARKTKLNENSAYRFLNQLEKQHILSSKKEGNLKKYGLQKNDAVYSILSYFDIQRFNSLPNIRKNAILYFLQQLGDQPIIAFLFGSTAKSTFSNQSDVDILLIVNKKINTSKAEKYADSQTALAINPIQITYDELKLELKLKNDLVIQSAINTGYPITNHIEYYRMINNERI
ncbi:MAG TPA: nucleotidyltransferase domain-containing protein [Candidatus Nanoarchaeia archaeon]|nr:nucleotidyltransferase domain-containing protein [Candidatus Nanoarchaeia archaeon]